MPVVMLTYSSPSAPSIPATWDIIQSNSQSNGGVASTTCSVTLANPVASGNFVVVFVGFATATDDLSTVTDNQGNSYTLQDFIETGNSNYGWHSSWLTNITNGPTTVTATSLASHLFTSILAIEVHPSRPVSFDTSTINTQDTPGNGTDAVTSGAVVTTAADFLIAGTVCVNSEGVVSGTGFTAIQTNVGSNSFTTEYLVQSAAGSQAATFTGTVGNGHYSTAVLAFKAV